MTVYKLSYFDIRGLGEYVRLLLEDNGIKYEDDRVTDWPQSKAKTPLGQLPTFQDGDFYFAQTGAILRHLARKHGNGLYGANNNEASWIDQIYDGIVDLRTPYSQLIYRDWSDENKQKLLSETLPPLLTNLEKLLKSKADGKAYFNGEKISFADYAAFEVLDAFLTLSSTSLDTFPALKGLHDRVANRPTLKAYLSSDKRKNAKINGNDRQ